MKLESLKPGMIVYDVQRYRMGSTTLSSVCVYDVEIISVDTANNTAVASWNGNKPSMYYRRQVARWRKSKPRLIRTGMFGQMRIARRGEQGDDE